MTAAESNQPVSPRPDAKRSSWAIGSTGLTLKLVALWGGTVFFAGLMVGYDKITLFWALAVPAVLLDFAGRCCCLAIPIRARWEIIVSIALQAVAILFLACAIFVGDRLYLVAALATACALQAMAAVAFTEFLGEVCVECARPDVGEKVTLLRRRLSAILLRIAGIGAVIVTMLAISFFVLLGFLLVWLLIPGLYVLALLTVFSAVLTLKSYGQALSAVRGMIRERAA